MKIGFVALLDHTRLWHVGCNNLPFIIGRRINSGTFRLLSSKLGEIRIVVYSHAVIMYDAIWKTFN